MEVVFAVVLESALEWGTAEEDKAPVASSTESRRRAGRPPRRLLLLLLLLLAMVASQLTLVALAMDASVSCSSVGLLPVISCHAEEDDETRAAAESNTEAEGLS